MESNNDINLITSHSTKGVDMPPKVQKLFGFVVKPNKKRGGKNGTKNRRR